MSALRFDTEEPLGGGISPLLAPNPWASPAAEVVPATLEPWQRPLLTQRKGYRPQGRLGALRGVHLDGAIYPSHREAARALLSGPAYGTKKARDFAADSADAGAYRADADELGVELLIDGSRVVFDSERGTWIDVRTGRPWRRGSVQRAQAQGVF